MLRDGDDVFKEAGDGYGADAAGDGSEDGALVGTGGIGVTGDGATRFRSASVNKHDTLF